MAQKMVKLRIKETSGVDLPAHLHNDWVVMKSVGDMDFKKVLATLSATQEATMQTDTERLEEANKALTKAAEDLAKSEKEKADLATEVATLKAASTPAAGAGAPVVDEAILKALPPEIQKMINDSQEVAKTATAKVEVLEATVTKAENDRLDREAVAKAKTDFAALTMDHEAVGKSLRQVAQISPEVAKAVETALSAANAQVKESDLFKTLGAKRGEATGGALDQLNTLAKAAAEKNGTTFEIAFAKMALEKPELYAQYQAELAGN